MTNKALQAGLEQHLAVSEAALAMESRWTYAALNRVDQELGQRLREQVALFNEACFKGTPPEIVEHGEAAVRGYIAATAVLDAAGEPDDAYILGHDPVSGLTVAIGQQKAAVQRVRDVHGERVVWISPDEIAVILAGIESFKAISAVKQKFPGAEMLDRYPGEPAKEESGVGE